MEPILPEFKTQIGPKYLIKLVPDSSVGLYGIPRNIGIGISPSEGDKILVIELDPSPRRVADIVIKRLITVPAPEGRYLCPIVEFIECLGPPQVGIEGLW